MNSVWKVSPTNVGLESTTTTTTITSTNTTTTTTTTITSASILTSGSASEVDWSIKGNTQTGSLHIRINGFAICKLQFAFTAHKLVYFKLIESVTLLLFFCQQCFSIIREHLCWLLLTLIIERFLCYIMNINFRRNTIKYDHKNTTKINT